MNFRPNERLINKKVPLGILFALLIIGLINAFLSVGWHAASGDVLHDDWIVEYDGQTQKVDLPYLRIVEDEGTIKMSREIQMDDQVLKGIVIPYPAGTAFRVYLNGEYIGGVGILGKSTANIWYTTFGYPLENVKPGPNLLEIEMYGPYDMGFRFAPYITEYQSVLRRVYYSSKMTTNLILMIGGVNLALGAMLLFAFWKSHTTNKRFLYMGIAGIMAGFIGIDCVFDVGLGIMTTLLVIKKIRFAMLFSATMMIALVFYEAKRNRKEIYFPIVIGLSILSFLPIAFSKSFHQWYTWMWIPFLFQGILFLVMMHLVLSVRKKNIAHITTAWIVLLTYIQGLLSNIFHVNIPNTLQFSAITVSMILAVSSVAQINSLYIKNKYLEDVSTKDSLTGAFNRRIIHKLYGQKGDSVVMLDLDNFKMANDRYGHAKGDELLVHLVKSIEEVVRNDDCIIRLGGDEFCILLKNCPLYKAQQKMEYLALSYLKSHQQYGVNISYGIVEVETDFEQSMIQADARMYQMKAVHKQG